MSALRLFRLPLGREVTGGVTKSPFTNRTSSSTHCAPVNFQRRLSTEMHCKKCLTMDNMNPNIKVMEYAVRGPLVIRAAEIERELKEVQNRIFPIVKYELKIFSDVGSTCVRKLLAHLFILHRYERLNLLSSQYNLSL